jgi:hypothetical protein
VIRRLLAFLTWWWHPHLCFAHDGSARYFTRYYVFGGPRDWDELSRTDPPSRRWRLPFNVMLQRAHRSDDALQLHNHPWKWCLSLVLAGGYVEERRAERRCACHYPRCDHQLYGIERRVVKPWRLNLVRAEDFHRIELRESDCWSLVIAGRRVQDWGFWSRITHRYISWREQRLLLESQQESYWRGFTLARAAVHGMRRAEGDDP